MNTISVHQPYATWVLQGVKRVENRKWVPTWRGWVGIHAAQTRIHITPTIECVYPEMVFGALIGVAFVAAVVRPREMARLCRQHAPALDWLGDQGQRPYIEGPYCWVLTRVFALSRPVPMKGRPGVFQVDDNHLAEFLRSPAYLEGPRVYDLEDNSYAT